MKDGVEVYFTPSQLARRPGGKMHIPPSLMALPGGKMHIPPSQLAHQLAQGALYPVPSGKMYINMI